jgi:tetratricopeptide (TPR) repeat protein/ADP-heptose:LPS heptosyltransferase
MDSQERTSPASATTPHHRELVEKRMQQRLARDPGDADALHALGVLARDSGRLNFSAELLRRAVQLNSGVGQYHFDLGLTVNRLGKPSEALDHFRRAIELRPDDQVAAINIGAVLHRLDQLAEAQRWFERALSLDPSCPIARYNLGNIHHATGRLDEAKRWYTAALEVEPQLAKAHWNKGLCHLLDGEFALGWDGFAWRTAAGEVKIDNYPQPRWRGEPLAGKTILLHAEQGIGDEILFATCLPDVIARSGRCMVVCEPRLAALFARSFPTATFIPYARRKDQSPTSVPEAVDYQAPLGDLPLYFRRNLESFPAVPSHLVPDEHRTANWHARFAQLPPGLKVGISWSAGGQPHERRKRSTSLSDWLPVLAIPGAQFINLQYGESTAEVAAAARRFGVRIHDFGAGDPLVDLDDFAAKIAALDLVISVGNTTVHLAGALGVPVWALLPAVPGWRWLIAGERNPWYKSVRAIRQSTAGDWRGVFAAAASRLCELVKESGAATGDADDCRGRCEPSGRARGTAPLECNVTPLPTTCSNEAALERGLDRLRAGDMDEAERLLNVVIAHSPRHLAALHGLGQIAHRTARHDLAVRLLSRASAVATDQPLVWLDLARSQLAAGRYDDSIASYRTVIQLDSRRGEAWFELAGALRAAGRLQEAYDAYCAAAPLVGENPKVFNFLGATCLEVERVDEAERAFRRAVELSPNNHAAWNNLGCTLARQSRHEEALACFRRVLEIDPANVAAQDNLAAQRNCLESGNTGGTPQSKFPPLPSHLAELLQRAGQLYNDDKFAAAEELAREVLKTEPNHPVALRIVGVAARRAGRLDESIEQLTQAANLDPGAHALWFELGVTYLDRLDHKQAFECFLRCHQACPQFQPACINLAGILEQQERYEEAIPWALKAVELNPDCHMAHYNLANNYREVGQLREAIAHYERAATINPQYARADWNLGICHLHLGNYEQGWPRYENRMSVEEVKIDKFTEPRWNGESLAGKTIVVHAEQGIGDEIVFSSCIPELIPRAGRVIIVCELRLEKLFRRSFPQCRVIGYARRKDWAPCAIDEPVDYQIPMGSLPLYLRPTRDSFPRRERFLMPDPALVESWRERFRTLGSGWKIGVSWRAGGKPLERRKRSVPIEMWAPLFGIGGVHFINLQYGDAIDDAAEVKDRFGITLHDWEQGDPLVDMDHFAAKVAALDLVISVGNATVHVAGAVGTPAWSLLPMVPSWRWMVEGDTSPWYSSVRLFRQPSRNDWAPVFDQISRMVRDLTRSPTVDRRRAMTVRTPATAVAVSQQPTAKSHDEWLDAFQFSAQAMTDSIPTLMAQANARADAGDLDQAEAMYRRILTLAPRFPAALHGLSRVARRLGKTELAIRSIKRALATAECVPERRCDLAAALADAGRYDEAAESYLRAIELNPQYVQAHFQFGLMLAGLGRHEEALARLRQAAALDPQDAASLVAMARSLIALCRPDEAVAALQEALARQHDCAAALILLAITYREDQRYAEAESCLRRALDIDPKLVDARLNLAELLVQSDRIEAAIDCYRRVAELEPNHYAALIQLGTLEDRLGRAHRAEQSFRRAQAALGPSQQPPRELINSLGITLADQGRLTEAIACYDRALAVSGDQPYPAAHANRAFALLQLGQFSEGWREYEWRWQCPAAPGRPRDHLRAPVWDGSSLAGRTLLIHGEQGLGDEIMFASCYPDCLERAAATVIVCQPRLERLFQRSFPDARVIAVVRGMEHRWQIPPRLNVDFQIAAGSLPLHLRRQRHDFPRRNAFLSPDAQLVARWRDRYAALGPGLKIGIAWRAGDKPKDRCHRTTQLAQWLPVLKTPGVCLINLQYGDSADELADAEQAAHIRVHHWPDADNRNDIDGLAARIAALDLVISVGNSTVHLAGALGVPAWSLLPANGGWRWLIGNDDTLWYPSVRLFRQTAPDKWEELFERVGQELMHRLSRPAESKPMRTIRAPHWPAEPNRKNATA